MTKILLLVLFMMLCGFTYKGEFITGDIVNFYYGHGLNSSGIIDIPVNEYKEAGKTSSHCWETETASLFSGPDSGVRADSVLSSPFLVYEIDVTEGVWYIWIDGDKGNPASDSVHFGLDGQVIDAITFLNNSFSNDLQKGGRATISSAAGKHLLFIWMREDGTKIRRIVLTKDSAYKPSQP